MIWNTSELFDTILCQKLWTAGAQTGDHCQKLTAVVIHEQQKYIVTPPQFYVAESKH